MGCGQIHMSKIHMSKIHMRNPQGRNDPSYLRKLKTQTRELLARCHDVLDDFPSNSTESEEWRSDSITELAAAVAETEELLRK